VTLEAGHFLRETAGRRYEAGTENRKKVGFLAVLAWCGVPVVYQRILIAEWPGGAPGRNPSGPARRRCRAQGGAGQNTPRWRLHARRIPIATPRAGRTKSFTRCCTRNGRKTRVDPMSIDPSCGWTCWEGAGSGIGGREPQPVPVRASAGKGRAEGPEPKWFPSRWRRFSRRTISPSQYPRRPPSISSTTGFRRPCEWKKTAFFLDGDEISVAAEGDTVKKRYRCGALGELRANGRYRIEAQQSLPLTEDLPLMRRRNESGFALLLSS